MHLKPLFIILVSLVLAGVIGCGKTGVKRKGDKEAFTSGRDLNVIQKEGRIRIVTNYNSTNYFVYKGTPMGYQLELLKAFADFMELELEISVNNDLETNFKALVDGEVDIIASNLAAMRGRHEEVVFTEPHSFSRQVLIQQKYAPGETNNRNRIFNEIIRNQLDLAGKTIYVQNESSYAKRLRNLADEIGDSINIVEISDYEVEQLIGLVAQGEIEYTVCDENLARVNLNYYSNIDVETAISFPQKLSWAVRENSSSLLNAINNWLVGFKKTVRYNLIYRKYFLNKRSIHLVDEGFHSIKGGQVSIYDDLIKSASEKIDWDWRLIASLIYQESRFKPDAESWAGARGLMQLMPGTAERFGVSSLVEPNENIRGGVELLKWLDERMALRIEDPAERIKFVLASYNVGIGHVLDAMSLAEKHGKDPMVWKDNVDYYLLHKSEPSFYNDPVVKHGYCRGEEPYQYVKDILERYDHYKNVMQ